jgi:phosphoadenylyl-sulfate reductase (thioredoxin)
MALIKNGQVASDSWITLADDAPVSEDGDVIVSTARLLADAGALKQRPGRLGVLVGPADDVTAIAPHLAALGVVALAFPKFSDGRAFSHARLLRERLGYTGEVRAVGDVLRDQLFYMQRVGFDAFEIPRDDAAQVFAAAAGEFRDVYQFSSDDRRPAWLLRRERAILADPAAAAKARAAKLDAELRDATPDMILRAAVREFPGKLAAVTSFGAEAAVLLDFIAKVDPELPLLFLETGKHFPETLAHRDRLVGQLGLKNQRNLHPDAGELETKDPKGDLHQRDTDACCALRKTRPLNETLKGFDAWITGRKRFQSETRLSLKVVEADEAGRIKFNPLANWTQEQLDVYMAERKLPKHPLVAEGYLSIGCAPTTCTTKTQPGESSRAGRWRGLDKDECGIHFGPDGRVVRTRTASADAT